MIAAIIRALLAVLFVLAVPTDSFAHKPSDSYLKLRVQDQVIEGQWDIALRDLDFAIGLDANQDNAITWGEVKAQHQAIAAYALPRLKLAAGGAPCVPEVTGNLVDDHSDGAYAVIRFSAACKDTVSTLDADYQLFFDIDQQHRGLLNLSVGDTVQTAIFSADAPHASFKINELSRLAAFVSFFREGVIHIWTGYDHILFLLSLLLPAVLVWNAGVWAPAGSIGAAAKNVIKVVTAFTVAHSITLSLAALGFVSLPSRFVESAIAASVVAAALNNIYPVVRDSKWVLAFCFGLIHGFGFASVLNDLGLPQNTLLIALVAFNLGVEAGQLVIVAVFLPCAFVFRGTPFYRRGVMTGGSLAVAAIASAWLTQRALNVDVLASALRLVGG